MSTIESVAPPPHDEFFPAAAEASGLRDAFRKVVGDARELIRFWPVVKNFVVKDLHLRYHRSILGFLWTLLNPILTMGTMALVFSQIFKFATAGSYARFLFAGLVPWGLLSATLFDCSVCIVGNEGLIRKIYVPKLAFPISRTLLNCITTVLSMAALFVLMVPLGARFSPAMVVLPLAVVLFATFALGLGLIVCVVNTYYRDFGHLVGVGVQAWYFLTPIMYQTNQMPAEARWKFWLNPAYPFIRTFQLIISEGQWPGWILIGVSAGIAAVSLGVGYAVFKCYEDKLIFRL